MRKSEPVRSKCILQHYLVTEKNPTCFSEIAMNTNKIPIRLRFLRSGNFRSLTRLHMAFLKLPSAIIFSSLIPNWIPGFQEMLTILRWNLLQYPILLKNHCLFLRITSICSLISFKNICTMFAELFQEC